MGCGEEGSNDSLLNIHSAISMAGRGREEKVTRMDEMIIGILEKHAKC